MTKDFEIIEDGVVDLDFGIKDSLVPNLML